MATRKSSQAQQNETPALPFGAIPGFEMWRDMMTAQTARFESMLTEMERIEKERHERSVKALDDVTNLMKSSLSYQQQLTDEWRKLGLEAARKGAEAFKG